MSDERPAGIHGSLVHASQIDGHDQRALAPRSATFATRRSAEDRAAFGNVRDVPIERGDGGRQLVLRR